MRGRIGLFPRKLRVARARRRFIKMVKAVNEGKVDKNLLQPGCTGEMYGSSKK